MGERSGGESRGGRAKGLAYGIVGYGLWGFMPLYINSVRAAPAVEVLAHRVLWAFLLLAALCWRQGQRDALLAVARDGRTLRALLLSSAFIAVNWLVYIWAVVTGRVLETSLGRDRGHRLGA